MGKFFIHFRENWSFSTQSAQSSLAAVQRSNFDGSAAILAIRAAPDGGSQPKADPQP